MSELDSKARTLPREGWAREKVGNEQAHKEAVTVVQMISDEDSGRVGGSVLECGHSWAESMAPEQEGGEGVLCGTWR